MNKVAFKTTIAFVGILLFLGIVSGLLSGYLGGHEGGRSLLIFVSFFLACYLAIRFFFFRYLRLEGFVVATESNEVGLVVSKRRWPIYWGFVWRLLVLGMISKSLSNSLFSNAEPLELAGQFLLVAFLCYLAIQWVLRQSYGRLRILSQEATLGLVESVLPDAKVVQAQAMGASMKDRFAGLFGGGTGSWFSYALWSYGYRRTLLALDVFQDRQLLDVCVWLISSDYACCVGCGSLRPSL
uniref:hypothetical protein n=2 Tax=Polynucleobacter sp. TaxID=2029855 RepID=UPI0040476567